MKNVNEMKIDELRAEILQRVGGDICGTSGPSTAKMVRVYARRPERGHECLREYGPFVGSDKKVLNRVVGLLREVRAAVRVEGEKRYRVTGVMMVRWTLEVDAKSAGEAEGKVLESNIEDILEEARSSLVVADDADGDVRLSRSEIESVEEIKRW